MAETAVNVVIDKLIPLLDNEIKLLRGVHGQVMFIKDQLALIEAFLKDADVKAEMADTVHLVKEWVKQVREVAFRIEDVIDEYMFKVASRRQRGGAVGVLYRTGYLLRTVISHHEISSAIGDIKESIVRLNQGRETFGFNPSFPEARGDGVRMSTRRGSFRLGAHFIEDDQLVGVDHTRNLLNRWLLNGERRRTVISVVGEGGLGKTTIVKNVYNKQKEKKSFDCYAWITVSRSLKEEHLLRTIIQSFYDEDDNKYAAKEISETIMDKDTLTTKLREYLQGRSYMIVFDDVWEIDFWEGVEFALPAYNNSKIIITTRDKGVAEFCRRFAPVHIHEMEPLHPNDALNLFLLKTFQFDPEGCPEELMGLSQDFVKKCDGVPLAIVAISGLLSTKKKTAFEWQRVYVSLRSKFSSDPHLRSFYQVLSESYHDLPYHLKLCLLYFGLFPEDCLISCLRLIRLWVAEGFVKENEKEDQTLEEIAKEYLAELIRRNLVKASELFSFGRVKSCKVHDLMHDFILKKCEELNFCQVIKNQEFRFHPCTRRLSIHEMNEDFDIDSTTNYGRVRSCFVCGIEQLPKPMVKSLFSSFKLLVTLDFEDSPLDYLPEAIGNLLNLKYLNVRKTKIKTIPKFIGNLQNLESLNTRDTLVRELPIEINKLVKLRHLISYSNYFYFQSGYWLSVKLNEGIGRLTALQTLTKVDTGDGDGIIKEMKNLKKMRGLGIKVRRHNGNQVCNAIKNMTHLHQLFIQATEEDEVLELQSIINPPPYLQHLYLDGRLERLPEWIPKLKNLLELRLGWSRLAEDPLPVLKCLSELLELVLFKSYDGEELHFREGWFTKLRSLTLERMPNLRTLKIDKRALPNLEELQLGICPVMVQVPTDIQNLEALKRLYLIEKTKEFVENIQSLKKKDTTLLLNDMIPYTW